MKTSFTALRIAGFKSFADPVTVDLRPGLTAIVGPNGCGKSNIVEAFRWIMGESSGRALRGGESDDLIFAGTVARPARNLVEVSLVIENARGLAAAPHLEEDTLEIIRTAKHGTGSDFRINGRAAQAHDVTQIFADLSLGRRSRAIVSKNRIGALIDAKPIDRRSLLENAAGISGLHFRRRDAQLKLRQAETNLQCAEDATFQLMERRDALEAQSASALAYREAVETIREVEAHLHAVQLARADAQITGCAVATQAALAKIASSEKTLQQLSDRRQTKAEQTVKWEAESEATRNAIETLRLAIEKERQIMAQNESDQNRVHSAITAAQEKKNRLQQRIDAMSAEARACHETIQTLAAQLSQLPKDIADCDADCKEAETLRDKAMRIREAQEQSFMQVRIKADALEKRRILAEDALRALPSPMNHSEGVAALDAARETEHTLHVRLDRLREKKPPLPPPYRMRNHGRRQSHSALHCMRRRLRLISLTLPASSLTMHACRRSKISLPSHVRKRNNPFPPLEANLTETCQHYEKLRAQLDGCRDAYMSLDHDIRETETALNEAQATIERAAEKHLQASTLRDRFLDSPPPAPCKTAPEDISERAEQNLRQVLTQALQKRDSLGAVIFSRERNSGRSRRRSPTRRPTSMRLKPRLTASRQKSPI
ncbi:MAG: AAA family ATPase [Acetobacteraceae bacterium]